MNGISNNHLAFKGTLIIKTTGLEHAITPRVIEAIVKAPEDATLVVSENEDDETHAKIEFYNKAYGDKLMGAIRAWKGALKEKDFLSVIDLGVSGMK